MLLGVPQLCIKDPMKELVFSLLVPTAVDGYDQTYLSSFHPLIVLSPLTLHALLTQDFSTAHEQGADVSAQETHVLCLHSRHAYKILGIGKMGIELGKLGVEMRVLTVLVG